MVRYLSHSSVATGWMDRILQSCSKKLFLLFRISTPKVELKPPKGMSDFENSNVKLVKMPDFLQRTIPKLSKVCVRIYIIYLGGVVMVAMVIT